MRFLVLLGFWGMAVLAGDTPRMAALEPGGGKAGTEITVSGDFLTQVTKVYISDGKTDVEVKHTAVEEKTLKFSIPESVKPGRYGLAILTKDNRMVDQPVRLTVE